MIFGDVLDRPARPLVDVVKALARNRIAVSVGGLVLTLVVATTYIVVGSLGISPARSTITVRVLLTESGGLLPNQDVTLRGMPIGHVTSITFTAKGVQVLAAINAGVPVPSNSSVHVSALSAAGEQYLDFRPAGDTGPALTNGSVIDESRTSVPVSLARLLADADGSLAQLDPHKLSVITDELKVSHQGPQKLAALLDGGAFLISTLDSVLPQTVSVLHNSRTVLTTMADLSHGLRHTSRDLQGVLRGINRMDSGFRTLVDRGGKPMTALDNIIADNSDTMVQLLGNLTTIAQLSYVRIPALKAIFDHDRSAADAVLTVLHDGGLWVVADIYPRYSCDNNLPRPPVAVPNFTEPFRYTYCANPDPAILVRGARNAPRPPGDDTAGPPPGYDPLAETEPTPLGPNTIPTPYGGPPMPLTPPK